MKKTKSYYLSQVVIEAIVTKSAADNRSESDWLDLLRPLAKSFSGFERRTSTGEDAVGPISRWFRTNTFYRKPNVEGKLESNGGELSSFLPKIEKGVFFALGPYTFTSLVC